MFLGEWFLDKSQGVPYYQHVFVKNFDPVIIDSIFKRVILTTPGILELLTFDIEFDETKRSMSLNFDARSTAGVISYRNYEVVESWPTA